MQARCRRRDMTVVSVFGKDSGIKEREATDDRKKASSLYTPRQTPRNLRVR